MNIVEMVERIKDYCGTMKTCEDCILYEMDVACWKSMAHEDIKTAYSILYGGVDNV